MSLSKLVYLSKEYGLTPLPKKLQEYVPQYDLLWSVSQNGLVPTATRKDISEKYLIDLYTKGKQEAGDIHDAGSMRMYLAQHITKQVEQDVRLDTGTKLEYYGLLRDYANGKSSLISYEVTSFADINPEEVILYPTGFEPLDTLITGIIPGTLITVAGFSGGGKTSVLLQICDAMQQYNPSLKLVWVSLEMSASAVGFRAKNLGFKSRGTRTKVITGITTLDELEEYIDSDTILVLDYVDIMLQASEQGLRHAITNAYARLLLMSKKCHCIFSPTQVNRSSTTITLNSLAESGSKAFYSELVLAVYKLGKSNMHTTMHQTEIHCLKNRFGSSGDKVLFDMDYRSGHMTYTNSYTSGSISFDEEAVF